MEKKKWEKPVLIVLMRGTPEEPVLEMCKAHNQTQSIGVNFKFGADCYRPSCTLCGTVGLS